MSDPVNWDERYQTGNTPWNTGHPSTELQRVLTEDKVKPCATLEIGCGTGVNAVFLAEQGFAVTAVDVSPLAVDRARERAAAAGVQVRFVVGDVLNCPALAGPFGFFFDRGVYHHLRTFDLAGYLRTLEKVLKPGAMGLVLTGNARLPRSGPPVVSDEEIRRELGGLFELVRLREFYFDAVQEMEERPLGWSCFLKRR
jgi:SAM-dependent methyltransferase